MTMKISIRQETERDYPASEQVIREAFEDAEYSDHKEHLLVADLRKSEVFVPGLSLVAEHEGEIVGHIIFTKLVIKDGDEQHESLALAPVSVLPRYQRKGIGSALIRTGLEVARGLGFSSVIVLGHEDYYPRFGFSPACDRGIRSPFFVSNESFLALELRDGSLDNVRGTVVYPKEFFG